VVRGRLLVNATTKEDDDECSSMVPGGSTSAQQLMTSFSDAILVCGALKHYTGFRYHVCSRFEASRICISA
jgi:hypothetical protein